MTEHNLLSPSHLKDLYAHTIDQTINAYDPQHIVLGEGLQNALDAVREAGGAEHQIDLVLDFRERSVVVADNGIGFPNDPTLLYLGGTKKLGKGLYGMIGAGLKVVLFSSDTFGLRASAGSGHFRVDLADAYRFRDEDGPELIVSGSFDPDPVPLAATGTELSYSFPDASPDGVFASCFNRVVESCMPRGDQDPLISTLQGAVAEGAFPTRFAAMLALFLRRYTYVGDVRGAFGALDENIKIHVNVIRDGTTGLNNQLIDDLFDEQDTFEFDVVPTYATAEDTVKLLTEKKLAIFEDQLGRAGRNMQRTSDGFNHLTLTEPAQFKALLENARGQYSSEVQGWMEEFETRLFPRINGITLTIGHIPDFYRCLPGGSRRVLSANGVVTTHDLEFTRGQNQQYVRCFDMCVDVDAQLNWGKSQITDPHLINRIRRFVNAAYAATIQNAAKIFVGTIDDGDDDDDQGDVFLGRTDLGLDGYVLRKEPTSEQDVIALFFELAGHGVFENYQVFGLSSRDRYDSRAAILTEGMSPEEVFNPTDEARLRVVEFKHTAAHIVSDFERNQKSAADIDLLIAWSEGTPGSPHFVFEDIASSRAAERTPSKVFTGVERYIKEARTGRQIQVLLLDRVVAHLREA